MLVCPWSGTSDDLLDPNYLRTLIAGRKSRERERERERERGETARCLHTNLLFWLVFLEYRNTMFGSVNQLPMRTQNPNRLLYGKVGHSTVLTLCVLLSHAHIFKLTKHSILNTIRVWSGSKPCLQMLGERERERERERETGAGTSK